MIVSLTGPPGSCKGSYGLSLATAFRAKLLTASDILRQSQDSEIRSAMSQGVLVDDEKTGSTLRHFLLREKQSQERGLLDGFPCTSEQSSWMQTKWPVHLQTLGAVWSDVPREVCRAKLW